MLSADRNSHRRCSIKKGVLKNSAIFAGMQPYSKRLQYRRFSVNIVRILRPPILKNIWERLLLYRTKETNSCILKANDPKIRLWNQYPIQSRLIRACQALIKYLPVCIADMVKVQFALFLFSKTPKYPSMSVKEENCLRYQFTVRNLCLTMWPWNASQNLESQGKTVRLGRFE